MVDPNLKGNLCPRRLLFKFLGPGNQSSLKLFVVELLGGATVPLECLFVAVKKLSELTLGGSLRSCCMAIGFLLTLAN